MIFPDSISENSGFSVILLNKRINELSPKESKLLCPALLRARDSKGAI
jgi:hypothetical protein